MDEPSVSIVIAVYNEAENVTGVAADVVAAFGETGCFELIFVDDGSTDATANLIAAMSESDSRIRLIRHAVRCAKSHAVRTGVLAARARWIATMDGDGQNDPRDLVAMLAAALASGQDAVLVAGIRTRRDDPLARRLATRFANGLIPSAGSPDSWGLRRRGQS
jgi:dolichol-phosphate mannosyltransferase